MDSSILGVRSLLIHQSRHLVLTPNPQGHPLPVTMSTSLRKGYYISPSEDLDAEIKRAASFLPNKNTPLLAFISTDPGGGIVEGRIFIHAGEKRISIADNLHDQMVTEYVAVLQASQYSWVGDWEQGKAGYFLTGNTSASNLWKIVRMETDAFGAPIFTLRAVRLLGDFPALSLNGIVAPLIRDEIAAHYRELQSAVINHSYRAAVTHARDIAEPVVGEMLRRMGEKPERDLAKRLEQMRSLRVKAELESFSDLAYHMAHKIRLMHALTHPDRTQKRGRAIEPGLALSCVEDLLALLREAELVDGVGGG